MHTASRGLTTAWPARFSKLAPVVAALLLSASGCGPDRGTAGLVDREVFIGAYVDLRVAALRNSGELEETERERILSEHGLTGADLTAFVEGHGPDLDFMRDLWNEIEVRMESAPTTEPDSDP